MKTKHYNSLQHHKRADSVKWTITWIVLFLMIAALVLGALQLFGKGKTKPSNWGAEEPPATEQDASGGLEIEEPENDDAKIQTTVSIIPRKLYAQYGIMPIAETAMQVTATIGTENDEPAEDGKLDWQLVWKDPQSEWASGKAVSDYVTIQVNEDTLTATLSCLQAFGEQLQLTAQIKTNPEVKSAPRTVNYVQRYDETSVNSVYIQFTSSYEEAAFTWNVDDPLGVPIKFPGFTKSYQEFLDYYSITGSKKGTYTVNVQAPLTKIYTKEATITNSKLIIKLRKTEYYTGGGATVDENQTLKGVTFDQQASVSSGNIIIEGFDLTEVIKFQTPPTNWAEFKRTLREKASTLARQPSLVIEVYVTVNGTEWRKTYKLFFEENSFGTFANSVDIGSGDIDFV